MKVGQYGSTLYLYTAFDMSAYVTLTIQMTRPNGEMAVFPAVLGTTVVTPPQQTIPWPANEWCSYVFQAGDLVQAGVHQVQVFYTDSEQEAISDTTGFTVDAS